MPDDTVIELLGSDEPTAAAASGRGRTGSRRTAMIGVGLAAVLVAGVVGAFTVGRDDSIRLVDVASTTEGAGSYRAVTEIEFLGGVREQLSGLPAGAVLRVTTEADLRREVSVSRTEVVLPDGTPAAGPDELDLFADHESRTIGRDVWVKTGITGLGTRSGPVWLHSTTDSASSIGRMGLQVDPADYLARLRGGRVLRSLPDATVAGTRVQRSLVRVDEDALRPAGSTDGDERPTTGRTLDVEVAVDSSGRLRRMSATQAKDGTGIAFSLTFTDFGIPVEVMAPDPSEVRESADFFGSTGSSTGSGSGAYSSELTITPDTTSPSSACRRLELFEAQLRKRRNGTKADVESLERAVVGLRETCAKESAQG